MLNGGMTICFATVGASSGVHPPLVAIVTTAGPAMFVQPVCATPAPAGMIGMSSDQIVAVIALSILHLVGITVALWCSTGDLRTAAPPRWCGPEEMLGHSSITITPDTCTSVLPHVAREAAEAAAALVPRGRAGTCGPATGDPLGSGEVKLA
ncbi:hypothetical protein QFW96_29660 [Saccharopolyspora sp. TS4A08]|uniref:Uncharacterized protein n=1 Tax=Saccharopolyspora ipomoeae TaxID=3042027 RepID=A0ABT6PY80_9PSEU|nr:hypothetical protein [Saccharopolyspora sp. TS4A08]MDI2032820.1 hypothetical protein [Saccharopolyspora sp. TS4A08]